MFLQFRSTDQPSQFTDGFSFIETHDRLTPVHEGFAAAVIAYIQRYMDFFKGHDKPQQPGPLFAKSIGYLIDYPVNTMNQQHSPKWKDHAVFRNYADNIITLVNACPSFGEYRKDGRFFHPLAEFFGNVMCYEFLVHEQEVREILAAMIAKIGDNTQLERILVLSIDWGSVYNNSEHPNQAHVTRLWQILTQILELHSERHVTLDSFQFALHAVSMKCPETVSHIATTLNFDMIQRQELVAASLSADDSDAQEFVSEVVVANNELKVENQELKDENGTLKRRIQELEAELRAAKASRRAHPNDEERKPAAAGWGPGQFGRTAP